jgi:transposase
MKKPKPCKSILTHQKPKHNAIMLSSLLIEDGYRQSQIAKHLNFSISAISKIVIEKRKSGNS